MEYGEACYKGVNDRFLRDADEDEWKVPPVSSKE